MPKLQPRFIKVDWRVVGSYSLTRPEVRVLLHIARQGEGTRYETSKGEKIPYSIIHDTYGRLLDKCLIRKVREERSIRNLPKDIYGLTPAGLLCALLYLTPKEFRFVKAQCSEIIQTHGHFFPKITGKWYLFKRGGVENFMGKRLTMKTGTWPWLARKLSEEIPESEAVKDFTDDFYKDMFLEELLSDPKNFFRVVKVWAEDPELREYLYPIAKGYYEEWSESSRLFKKLINHLNPKKSRVRVR